MEWLAGRAETLGLDPDRFVLMGESAGGNLAVNAALHAHRTNCLSLRSLALIYPVTDMRPFTGVDPIYPSVETYAKGMNLDATRCGGSARPTLKAPDEGVLPENTLFFQPDLHLLPPTRIYNAECDPLRDMGLAFATRLIEAGVEAQAECLPGMLHSFMCHGGISSRALRHFFCIVEDISASLARSGAHPRQVPPHTHKPARRRSPGELNAGDYAVRAANCMVSLEADAFKRFAKSLHPSGEVDFDFARKTVACFFSGSAPAGGCVTRNTAMAQLPPPTAIAGMPASWPALSREPREPRSG